MEPAPYINAAFTPSAAPQGTSELDHLNKGLYAYVNAAHDPELKKQADTIFGRTVPFDNSEETATLLGRSWCSRTGYLADPVRYCRDNKLPLPPNWSGENAQLYTLIGQNYIGKAQEHFNNQKAAREKALADAQKDYTETMGELPSLLAKSIRSAGGEKGTPLTPQYLEKLTKYGAREGAIQSQQRAATAWMYMSAYMDDPELLKTGLGLREKLLDIANTLSDDKGQLDPAAMSALVIMAREKALEKQAENNMLDRFNHALISALEEDQDTDMASGLGRTLAYQEMIKRKVADSPYELDNTELRKAEDEAMQFAADLYSDKVTTMLSVFREAMDLSKSAPDSASFMAKAMSDMEAFTGRQVLPTIGQVAGALATRGAGGGKFLQFLGGWAGNAYASYDSNLSRAYADAVRDGKINPAIHASIQAAAESASEGAFSLTGSLPILSKTAGKAINYVASRTAANSLARNTAIRTMGSNLGGFLLEGAGELLEEELSNAVETSLNKLARIAGVELTPVQYKMGEALGNMKPHEITAVFLYAALMGSPNIPSTYRAAANFAVNSDNLLAAGHSPAAVRDIQNRILNAQDKEAEIFADTSLSQEQKKKQTDKLWEEVNKYQRDKAQSDIYEADPEEVRQRLQKQNKKTLEKAELALAIQAELDMKIAKKFGIIDTTAQPGDKFTVTLIEKGEKQADGTTAQDKLVQQEWTRNQLVNFFQIQKQGILTNSLRGFQSLVQAHAAAQTITNIDDLKIQIQELREIPYEAYATLKKHNGITTEYIADLINIALNLRTQYEAQGMTRAEAEAQPSNFLEGVSLGELISIKGAAAERRDSAADTTEGKLKGITKGKSVEYGAINITRADGSVLIAYVNSRSDTNDLLEELLEAHIKHTIKTTGLTYSQLGSVIKDVEKHLPSITTPDGKKQKLTLLPENKKPSEYTQSDIVEAYSKIALAHYLYNEEYLPITQGGHQLLREIGRVVDVARLYKAIGDAWHTYAKSPEGKAHLANGGASFADLLRTAGFKVGSLVAQAKATAQQQIETIEASNWQPAIEEELDALLEDIEAEEQLSEINQQEANQPTTIPAEESITGQEITVEPTSEHGTLVSLDDTPESHLRNLITQGKATIRDFADFFKDHDITEAQATELGIRPLGQNGEPTYTYRMGLRLGIGMRFGTYTSEEQIQNFIIVALVDERVREIAGEDTTSYKLERKAEDVRKNARIFRDTASASRAKYNQAKAAGGSLSMPEAPQWPAPKKKADNSQDNIVNILAPMTSKDKYRDFLTVIHKETKDGITSYVATDGTRLSMLSRKASSKEDSHIVINPKTKEEDNAANYATLHWRQVIPTKADIETTIDLAPMLALKNFRKKGGTKAGFRLTSAGTTHRSVIIKAEDHTIFVDAFRFREAVEQLANLSKTLGFPSIVKLSLLKEGGPITLSASHNGWEWKALIMPLSKANESAGDIILSEKPTILASVEKHSEDYIEKLRQDAEYDEAKAQEFEEEATNLEEQARILASVEAQLPENDRLARWVASYFERPRMSAIFDVIKTIRSGDVQKFMPWLTNPENNLIRKLYEKISGTKLPKNTDDYKAAVDKWVSTLHPSEESSTTFSIKPITAEQAESTDLFTDGVLEAENAIVTKPDVNFSIKAMHASPHEFYKFSTDFMGSGEGAQIYGWGLYFMTNQAVNRAYVEAFLRNGRYAENGNSISDREVMQKLGKLWFETAAKYVLHNNYAPPLRSMRNMVDLQSPEKTVKELEDSKSRFKEKGYSFEEEGRLAFAKAIVASGIRQLPQTAYNYKIELNVDESTILLWDDFLPSTSPLIEALEEIGVDSGGYGKDIYQELCDNFASSDTDKEAPRKASEWLHAHGYKGIKYLDGNSRSAGEGTYNYVIFSGDDIKITAINRSGVWSMDEGWEEYTDPTANFSIKPAASDTLDRFTADPLGERILHHIRTESRRYARLLGDKTPYEQAVNAAQSAASIISAVDKYLHTPGKPVPARYRRQLQKLRSIAEKYAQIIASGTPRSFKKISPQEKQELETAIAELEAQELDTAETDPALLIEDSDRLTKREAAARAREHHRAIVRSAAKGRVYQTLSSMLEVTADALDSYLKHQLLQKLDRLTATVKIKRSPSNRLQGKMTAPAYRELERAINLMALSDRAYQDEIENVITAHETLARAINQGNTNLTSGNALLIQLADQLTTSGQQVTPQTLTAALANHEAALKIYGNVSSKNYEQTRLMANALFYLIRNGRNQWKDRHEAREARIQSYLRYFLAHTTPESETANAKRNKNESQKWKDALSLDITMNAAQTIMALSSYEALRPLMQDLLVNYSTAAVARQKHLQEIRKQELYAFGRIIGITPATQAGYTDKQLKEISDKFDTFYAENNKTVETTITPTRLVRNAAGELEHSTSAPLKLTKWEALNLILTYRQEHYQPNAQEHGFTPEILTQLENFIGQQMMDYGNAIQQILVNDGTIPVYEEREGIPMRDNPLYWPGHININTINTTRDEPLVNPYHPAASHDFLHARVRNRQEVGNRNAFGVFRQAIADRANYVYADPVTDTITSLLARDQFANRLETLIGGSLKRQLQTLINEIKGAAWQETSLQDATSGLISAAFGAKSLAVLSGNPSSLIRQFSAVANAGLMPGISPQQYLAYAIKAKQNQSHISFTDILKLDAFTTRKRDNAYVNEMIAMGADATFSTLMNWAKTGINAMDKLDLYANAFSATVIYNIKYDQLKAQGTLTEEQIRKRCEQEVAIYTKLLAQPLNRVDKSALYWMIGNHAIGRSILFMGSEAINKVGMLRANYITLRNQGKNPATAALTVLATMGVTVGIAASITEAALALLLGRTPDDDDSTLAFALALWLNASYGQYLSVIPLLGGVTDTVFSPYGGYLGNESVLPGSQLFTRDIGKLHTMLTDDKEYSTQQWNKEINRFMRNFTTILGYAGGANSQWQIYSSFAAFCQSLTAALNAEGFIFNVAANLTDTADEKTRRPKSRIEKWLTPSTEESPRRATSRRRTATRSRTTARKRKRQEE